MLCDSSRDEIVFIVGILLLTESISFHLMTLTYHIIREYLKTFVQRRFSPHFTRKYFRYCDSRDDFFELLIGMLNVLV